MKKLLWTIILMTAINHSFSNYIIREKIIIMEKEKTIKARTNTYKLKFNETIEFIKKHEGFRTDVYGDLNGYKTIGYGFLIKYIGKKFRKKITREQSDSILIQKLSDNVKYVKKKYPHLNEYQNLSVAHMIYCKGAGRISRHSVGKQIRKGYIEYWTLVHFSRYEKKKSPWQKHYQRTRKFEYNLFYFKKT